MPVYKRGDTWWVRIGYAGQKIRRSAGAGATKAQAKELEAKIRADLWEGRLGRKPDRLISEAIIQWKEHEATRLKHQNKWDSHLRALYPYIKGRRMSEIVQVAEAMKGSMRASPQTVNNRLAILRRVANLAYKTWEWLDQPIGQRITLLRTDNERHVYLAPEQVEELARAAMSAPIGPKAAAADMIRLAAYSGLRRSELFRLTAADYRDGCLFVAAGKTGKPRVVPLPPEAESIAARLPLPITDPQLRRAWDHARDVTGHKVRFHDLRHTYGSWLTQAGVNLRAVQALLGHQHIRTTQRYTHLDTEHLKEAVGRLHGRKDEPD